jgi:hypothetical protein
MFFIKMMNIILLFFVLFFGIILFLVAVENEKDQNDLKSKSLILQEKKSTMLSKEIIQDDSSKIVLDDEVEKEEDVDPDLEYAIKLFESSINKNIQSKFKKPFNYKEGSYCYVEFDLSKQNYRIKDCNSDAIFKRALSLSIDELMPIKRITYNNIKLTKQKILIRIDI